MPCSPNSKNGFRWCSEAGKVTICLATHSPCVTDSLVYPPMGTASSCCWSVWSSPSALIIIIIPAARSYLSSCNHWPSFVSSRCIYPLELSPTWHLVICLLVYLLPASKDTSISSVLSWRVATINCFSRLRFRGLRNNICYFSHVNKLWLTLTSYFEPVVPGMLAEVSIIVTQVLQGWRPRVVWHFRTEVASRLQSCRLWYNANPEYSNTTLHIAFQRLPSF